MPAECFARTIFRRAGPKTRVDGRTISSGLQNDCGLAPVRGCDPDHIVFVAGDRAWRYRAPFPHRDLVHSV